MKHCPKCGTENKEEDNFCKKCGTTLEPGERFCPKCGTENPEGAVFCVSCGGKLETYPEPEEETQAFITEEIEEPEIVAETIEAEIIIERSPTIVWKYFTNHRNWEKWGLFEMKSAQWHKGGKLVWGGSIIPSEILDIIPGNRVIIRDTEADIKWEFEASGLNSTRCCLILTPRGGAYFDDDDALDFNALKLLLRRLKERIEKETIGSPSSKQHSIKNCPKCGTENPEDAIFCAGCGVNFKIRCTECGTLNRPEAEYCNACGKALTFEYASGRATAVFIDWVVISIIYAFLLFVFPDVVIIPGLLLIVYITYFTVLEGPLNKGQTIGKKVVSIRVVKDVDRSMITYQDSLIRNILRLVDMFPYLIPYLVGSIAIFSSKKHQRLGDRAANTIVIVA